jgi:hypothetical protein
MLPHDLQQQRGDDRAAPYQQKPPDEPGELMATPLEVHVAAGGYEDPDKAGQVWIELRVTPEPTQVTSMLSFDLDPEGALRFAEVLVVAADEVRSKRAVAA